MNVESYYPKIADLVLFAIDFQAGEKLVVKMEPQNHAVGIVVAEEAYRRGAAYVHFSYLDHHLDAAAIKGKKKGEEFWFPRFMKEMYDEVAGDGWKYIALYSVENSGIYESLNKETSALLVSSKKEVTRNLKSAQMGGELPWTLTFLPTPKVAAQTFPHLSASEAIEAYWRYLVEVMALDHGNPREYWQNIVHQLDERSRKLNELGIASLSFKGPGTDLRVGVLENSVWVGGSETSSRGGRFIANLPTFEVYTSPDYRATEGRVALTKPLILHESLGPIPRGAWFEFEKGKVVRFGAEEGEETLEMLFKIDDRNRYIGEVALVDAQTPIAKSGITFYNGLYDENAACHIALGQAYSMAYKGGSGMNDAQLLEAGLNAAKSHEDMMIGSEKVDVSATLRDGGTMDLIRNGMFAL